MVNIVEDLLFDVFELQEFISKEEEYHVIIQKTTQLAMKVANADACFFYNIDNNGYLSLDYSVNQSLKMSKAGIDNLSYASIVNLSDQKVKIKKSAVERSALNKEVLNLSHIYVNSDLDNSFFEKYDLNNNYTTNSVLTIPLIDKKEDVIAVAQFVNALDSNGKSIPFTKDMQRAITFLCELLAYLVENRRLRESYGHLLESFIEVIARAIDAKSPYTGSHCQHVPVITRMLATAAVQEDSGPLAGFEMTSEEWYSLHIASWLHDCGKLTTPEYIVDKATKLETINNRIHEIRSRFEILRRDAHIEYLKKRLGDVDTKENLEAEFVAKVKKLEDDFDFVARCNIGDNAMSDDDISRLKNISEIKFKRYFSRMKGLSWAERDSVVDHELYSKPSIENLLQNREDHLFGGYNRGELYNLEIRRGTITAEERTKINEHIEVTIDMLKALPFPKELSNVVEYAGSHHERMDGQGYPNGLTGEEMSIPARVIAIADIFEALTASDRPYKETKTLSQVLSIMKSMKNTGHIDPDLYRVFINNKVYLEYAKQYMKPEQIDEINPGDYL
ncbi:MAG: HD domain-containing protein [Lactobacillaceae bacterium]|nr:HD domain-containing protein [Lactobacillaceae bacterium]